MPKWQIVNIFCLGDFFPIVRTILTLSLSLTSQGGFKHCTKIHLIRYVNRSTWPLRMAMRRKCNAWNKKKTKMQYETDGIERLQLNIICLFNSSTIFRFDFRPPIIHIMIFLQFDMSHWHRICIMSKASSRQRWIVYQVGGKAFEWWWPIAIWRQEATPPTDSTVDFLLKDMTKQWRLNAIGNSYTPYLSIFGKNIHFDEWLGCRLRPTNWTALNVEVTVGRNISNVQLVSVKVFDEILETVFVELILENA